MSDAKISLQDFSDGMQTTHGEDGLPLGWWAEMQNVLLTESPKVKRRGGMQRVFRVTNAGTCFNLNGTSEFITIPNNTTIQTLKKQWTVKVVCSPDTVVATRTLLSWNHATTWPIRIQFLSTSLLQVKVTDSAGTVTTLSGATVLVAGTTYVVVVVRNGTALTVYLNGVLEATGSMADLNCIAPSGDMYLGNANGGSFFDGPYDHATAWSAAITSQSDIFLRCVEPTAPHVLWHYIGEETESTTHRVDDESRFENHGSITAGFATATSIARQSMPVNLIAPYIDKNNKQRTVIVAGKTIRLAEIGA